MRVIIARAHDVPPRRTTFIAYAPRLYGPSERLHPVDRLLLTILLLGFIVGVGLIALIAFA